MLLPEGNIDGWALLDYIRTTPKWRHVPVILTTGLGIASLEWSTAHGALDFLRKPIDVDELLRKIKQYCA